MSKIITLTTDFGSSDAWVGIMKGVILSVNPDIRLVDITHDIPPQDITKAALSIGCLKNVFPEGTVHLIVVDPGVGSSREPVIIKTKNYFYVGPNNGVFTLLDSDVEKAVKITNSDYFRARVSVTFHGRDIFAPVAANLFNVPINEFGPPLEKIERLPLPVPIMENGGIKGEVTYIDRFGNPFTNISADMIRGFQERNPNGSVCVDIDGKGSGYKISYYYQSVGEGKLGAIINSLDILELFTPNGNASKAFGIKKGDKVFLRNAS